MQLVEKQAITRNGGAMSSLAVVPSVTEALRQGLTVRVAACQPVRADGTLTLRCILVTRA